MASSFPVAATAGSTCNPATEALLSRIPDGTAEEARLAIDAAERAQPGWEALPAIERAGWLRKLPPVSASVPTRSPG